MVRRIAALVVGGVLLLSAGALCGCDAMRDAADGVKDIGKVQSRRSKRNSKAIDIVDSGAVKRH